MIPPAFVQELIGRTDIVELVGRSVELKRAGTVWKGLCPFHAEKSPSFTVSPSRQTYHCFGCGVHGNAVGFLMEHHGQGFVDAVQDLAQQAGLAVPEDTRSSEERDRDAKRAERKATLADVLDRAAAHYRAQLKASPRAIDYLKGRGLTGEIAARYGLGYAPAGWRPLASAVPAYDDPLLVESGLVVAPDDGAEAEARGDRPAADGRRYDRFRDRIMFPIRAVSGETIGFGGRVLESGDGPKYLNSPETPIFVKGRELYGLFEARQAIRKAGHAIVVEGNFDVVMLAQHGVGQAVATLGTACTAEHVQKLARFTDQIVFSFDGDAAGRRAAGRALEAALPHAGDTTTFRFLFLPPEHDPDSFVRSEGAAAYARAVAAAEPLSRFLVTSAADGLDLATAEGRARFLAVARPLWSALPEGMLKRQLLGELARQAALETDELATAWQNGPSRQVGRPSPVRPADRMSPDAGRPARAGRPERRPRTAGRPEDSALRLLLLESGWWDELGAEDHDLLCALPGWHGLAIHLLDRAVVERGAVPWAVLREQVAVEPWGAEALAAIEGDHRGIEPIRDELTQAIAQMRRGPLEREAMRVLGRH